MARCGNSLGWPKAVIDAREKQENMRIYGRTTRNSQQEPTTRKRAIDCWSGTAAPSHTHSTDRHRPMALAADPRLFVI